MRCHTTFYSLHTINKLLCSAQGQGRRIQLYFRGREIKDSMRPLASSAERLRSYRTHAVGPSLPVIRRCWNDGCVLCSTPKSCLFPLVHTLNPLDKHPSETLSSSSYLFPHAQLRPLALHSHSVSGKLRAPVVPEQRRSLTIRKGCSCPIARSKDDFLQVLHSVHRCLQESVRWEMVTFLEQRCSSRKT